MDKTNKETVAEYARQNWHITEMQHNWATRRKLAKKNAADLIAHHKAEKEKQIKPLNEEHEARKAAIEKDCAAKVFQVEQGLEAALREVAIDQDEYMHRFRNYVASLPKDEQNAYNTREDRE
jgi:hypothetical protein